MGGERAGGEQLSRTRRALSRICRPQEDPEPFFHADLDGSGARDGA